MEQLGQAIAAFVIAFTSLTAAGNTPEAAAWWALTPDIEQREQHWTDLAWCETRNRNIADAGGSYRGFVQFHRTSWEYVGGTGDPMAWPWHEQIYRAERLFSLQSWHAWPGCGKRYAPLAGLVPLHFPAWPQTGKSPKPLTDQETSPRRSPS